ncbi:bifunctional [glutamine synthetase] adenylyltransferase/[glutamine synthetase]-adenylyl-L-tyrosine phosphorylase [Nesterenkonia natronophila]|uniref:Bifunctional [glutamine synthetase] adenylyltransferase/[glutamine synthetase]-adenylyl-L-tyrosine phosphorylase n=1 Tax=Nesterenkonia natronophila TaxID=2174932 RepID=A0A3A4FYT8_9MICC|nr:bifunctional [glutamine synthetase] adenylyltransferase/[glutamine synthetase]-adenylyl-L-tyrosine phosphorylase [Nesterenkonia natronophila]RJN31199.1 bifunctional [glutamine synthetase] adenylyltransferase/[glutamine synthetase]-adenylyl-L-tyrosine phosphorylase [Nesterenkonia natronophila]
MSTSSETSSARELIAAGFQDLERAQSFLTDPQLEGVETGALTRTLHEAPDADQALLLLIRLVERAPRVRELFSEQGPSGYPQAVPLVRLLGASRALAEFLIRHPGHTDVLFEDLQPADDATPSDSSATALRRTLMDAVRADPDAEDPASELDEDFAGKNAGSALRIAYRRELTRIALRDLTVAEPQNYLPLVARQLADLAAGAIDAALAVSRAQLSARRPQIADLKLAVIGMGKCGAGELNYISDVDVVFAHSATFDAAEAGELAAVLASGMTKIIMASDGEPGLWEVDANLRPEGRDGPLSRTVDSHREYYRRWAAGWELQALLKARPIAGNPSLGEEYMESMGPLVWQAAAQEGFVQNVQAMRRRVFDNIPHRTADREIKLGRGGLRDIEFTVQLLQLVHGRVDDNLRMRDTLSAIEALGAGEYVSSKDQKAMSRCYRQLRLYEHRIQMSDMRRTHLMPVQDAALRALSHAIRGPGQSRRSGPKDIGAEWQRVAREVSTFHETIFYRPLLSTTAVLSEDDVRLSASAVADRLSALGFSDAEGALRHIEALTAGVSRKATLQKRILPMMLGWFAEGVDPDHGLLAFRRLSESLGTSPWYLTMLRDSSVAAERLCQLLTSSRFISDVLEHLPESAKWLGDDDALAPRSFETLWTEMQNALQRHEGASHAAVRLARLIRQREQLRIAISDACGVRDQPSIGAALADVDRVTTLGALRVAEEEVFASEGRLVDFLVIAMGRQGGREISYGSDMDALFVHRPVDDVDKSAADKQAQKLAQRLTQLLSKPVKPAIRGEFALQLDADLRPEGKRGPLSRSLDSYEEYYRRWMDAWERQALLRARPVAGSDWLAVDFMELVDEVRYGAPPTSQQLREIRRIKARIESERLPRGADPSRHVKLGRGGLSDVEWLVQLYQLQFGHEHGMLRGTSTLQVLNGLVDAELMSPHDANTLAGAWKLCTKVRSGIMIWSARAADVLPSSRRDLEAVSRWCGFEPGCAAEFEDHYLRTTRRARQVFEQHFYASD